jgi:hypothetical protein
VPHILARDRPARSGGAAKELADVALVITAVAGAMHDRAELKRIFARNGRAVAAQRCDSIRVARRSR